MTLSRLDDAGVFHISLVPLDHSAQAMLHVFPGEHFKLLVTAPTGPGRARRTSKVLTPETLLGALGWNAERAEFDARRKLS